MNRSSVLLFVTILLSACSNPNEKKEAQDLAALDLSIKYARGFTIAREKGAIHVEVTYPYQGATSGYKYLLVKRDEPVPEHGKDVTVIYIPIRSIVCTATSHLPLLDYLEESETLVGFPSLDYVSSEKIRKQIDSGKVKELGVDLGLNIEQIAMLKPDLLMGYTMTGDLGQYKKIQQLGIPVVLNAEYLEEHPLGRAEWIKFMALFFNKEKEASLIFEMIEKNYLNTKTLAATNPSNATVLSGVVYGDAWFLPGGQNYSSQIFKDAGLQYLWEDNPSNGYLQLSLESVYEKAHDADYWLGVASFNSLEEIKNADERYTKFKSFQTKQVYTYDARKGAKGGSEFLELGYLRPDIILKDLVKIVNPDLLPEYQLYFYKKLE